MQRPSPSSYLKCYVTDRHALPAGTKLLDAMARSIDHQKMELHQPDWIQIREKDLSARELLALVNRALRFPGVKIIVNTRMDIALASGDSGAAGCHLPSDSPPPRRWRRLAPPGFLIGVSCHTVEEVRAAETEGADYVFFGPVFPPLSKTSPLPARGLNELARAANAVRIPVLALGGITETNVDECVSAGAAGIAAISLFQDMPQTTPFPAARQTDIMNR